MFSASGKVVSEYPEFGRLFRIYANRVLSKAEMEKIISDYSHQPGITRNSINGVIDIYPDYE